MRMGLPVKRLVIATNENDEFPRFMAGGTYRPIEPSRNCISSAMNVGHPSNLARLIDLYGGRMDEKGGISAAPDMERLRREIFAVSVRRRRDAADHPRAPTNSTACCWSRTAPSAGPACRNTWPQEAPTPEPLCISLETAHPAKFPEEIRAILGFDPPLPPSLEGLEEKSRGLRLHGHRLRRLQGIPAKELFLRPAPEGSQ